MDRKQAENYIFFSTLAITAIIFVFTPAYPGSSLEYLLDEFCNRYLFGNGWYKPSNYPFAAKITNSLSVVFAISAGVAMGIWRKNDIITPLPKNIWWSCLFFLVLGVMMLWESIFHQEFKITSGRSFGTSEAFHNNPISFVSFMAVKAGVIYAGFRFPISLILYLLSKKK
ncbi:hypothetical protein [Neisseria sp.]|uniref:hypothetical protein n=1 Tax=Neisseria sp. TaxID=192066 RepID=UPI0026DDB8F8|nr:hypothetical protein [Neisseria sp.]MDO4907903.1 hypothetical protein [Neisseria sp.]